MNKRTFIFRPNWLDAINTLADEKDQLDLFRAITYFGCAEEEYEIKNPAVRAIFESFVKDSINNSQERYAEKRQYGEKFGRSKVVDDEKVRELAKRGLKAKQVAECLGISEAAVYHSDGWKNRKDR